MRGGRPWETGRSSTLSGLLYLRSAAPRTIKKAGLRHADHSSTGESAGPDAECVKVIDTAIVNIIYLIRQLEPAIAGQEVWQVAGVWDGSDGHAGGCG